MTPLAEQLLPLAAASAKWLGCEMGDESLVRDGELGHLEHLIHEVSHAVSLDIPVRGPALATAISNTIAVCAAQPAILHALDGLDEDDMRDGIKTQAEAVAWAIEVAVWWRLDLPIEVAEAYCHAEVQGVRDDHLARVLDRDWSWQADTVVGHLQRVCRNTKRRLNKSCQSGNIS